MIPTRYEFSTADRALLERELEAGFRFFWETTPTEGPGYGLSLDTTRGTVSSIASVGFALPTYVIGAKNGYVTKAAAYERVLKTLQTILNVEHEHGFLVHFVDSKTGQTKMHKNRSSEFSTIDTTLFLCGAIVAGEYFKGEVAQLVNVLLERVDWSYYFVERPDRLLLGMGSIKEIGMIQATWDHYAEQLAMYFLYAGHPQADHQKALDLYFGFDRWIGAYKGNPHVYCFGNALFIHQFSHAFFDFRRYVDAKGYDWFQNSVDATLAHRQFAIDLSKKVKTLHENSWGGTAHHTKKGYGVYGAPPVAFSRFDFEIRVEGYVAPYAALCSLPFTPKESMAAARHYASIPQLWGRYGFVDAYNLDLEEPWYATDYLGIDKGPTVVMIDNVLNGTIWELFTNSAYIQRAIKVLKFQPRDDWSLVDGMVKIRL